MNQRDENQLSEQYARVPRVASPEHLDDKILQAARIHAPEKVSLRDRRWMPALATACLAGMVFYVATPLLDRQSVEQLSPDQYLKQRDDALSDATVEEIQSFGFDASTTATDSISAAPAAASSPAPQQKTVLLEQEEGRATAGLSVDEPELFQQRAQTTATKLMKKAEKTQTTNAFAPSTATTAKLVEEKIAVPMASRERKSLGDRELSEALTAEEITSRLEKIRTLADKRLTEEAERMLARLLDLCPDCDIPTSLAALRQSRDADIESSGAEID